MTTKVNHPEILDSEGFTFQEAIGTLKNESHNFKEQIEHLKTLTLKKPLKVKDLRSNQYLIDVSKWCQLDGASEDGGTNTVIVITVLEEKEFRVLVNSTIPCYPAKHGGTFLKKQISKSSSILYLIEVITDELKKNRRIADTMKLSAPVLNHKTYMEMLQDCVEWESQSQLVDLKWPNRHFHSSWTNSKVLSTTGTVIRWEELCNKVKDIDKTLKAEESDEACEVCDTCNEERKGYGLFVTSGKRIKCTNCLRDEFYNEFNARRLPINLEIDNQLENLPTFIPLTLINHYVRMIYKDSKESEVLEKCSNCRSTLFLIQDSEPGSSTIQNLSCQCGHFWCRHCDRVPHWPMTCKDYAKWEDIWLLRYPSAYREGTNCTLLQGTCPCENRFFQLVFSNDYHWFPSDTCPMFGTLDTSLKELPSNYQLYNPRSPKPCKQKYYKVRSAKPKSPPHFVMYTEISTLPDIPENVLRICKEARDFRLTRGKCCEYNDLLDTEEMWLKWYEAEVVKEVKDLLCTVTYLSEMVTAWMYVTNREDKEIEEMLEILMRQRAVMVHMWEEDSDGFKENAEKIRNGIKAVVKAVEEKMVR